MSIRSAVRGISELRNELMEFFYTYHYASLSGTTMTTELRNIITELGNIITELRYIITELRNKTTELWNIITKLRNNITKFHNNIITERLLRNCYRDYGGVTEVTHVLRRCYGGYGGYVGVSEATQVLRSFFSLRRYLTEVRNDA